MWNRNLLDSITKMDVGRVKSLLSRGMSAEGRGWSRMRNTPTPLIAAVKVGSTELVEVLLAHGADPNRETRSWMPPLSVACKQGDLAIAELLLSKGARVNPSPSSRHPSAIEMAAWYGHDDVANFLLDHGANPDLVLSRDVGSVVRVPRHILARLIAAGGHASSEVEILVKRGEW